MHHYDYIISGAGAAGLSLLMRFMSDEYFKDKKILVIDKEPKNKNDHTWCFWERSAGLFEPVVFRQWKQVSFYSLDYTKNLDLAPYSYKMIRSVDFYNYVLSAARSCSNISFVYGEIRSMTSDNRTATITVDDALYTGDYIFNSTILTPRPRLGNKHYLLQHFKGYVIETNEPVFNADVATLMDFRVSQHRGTTFVYVLPFNQTSALVEYTLFTKNVLKDEEYDSELHKYITDYLKVGPYRVTEQEFGIIPMTNAKFSKGEGRIVNVGTAGGKTKGSSGYTFRFIQKHSDAIVCRLKTGKSPIIQDSVIDFKFKMFDSVFLNVLAKKRLEGREIFTRMFKQNKAETILKFLDNETNMLQDLKIITSLPTSPFLNAAVEEVKNYFKN